MKRPRKSKGVSWTHGVDLCQDCPSKAGLKSSDYLEAETPRMLHPYTAEFKDCPPGFEVTPSGTQLANLSSISLIKWRCPLKFVMDCNWCVTAGEESIEVESQKLREMRFLEVVYPRVSAIPSGASVSTDIEDELYDDSFTPLVPIIPIEEDECEELEPDSAAVGNLCTSTMPVTASNIQLEPAIHVCTIDTSAGEKPTEKLPDVGMDVAAVASTALTVLMKSMEQGSVINTNLLIKIFSDPKMIQNLANIPPVSAAVSGSTPLATAAPISLSKPVTKPVSLSFPKSDLIPKLPNGSLLKVPNRFPSKVATVLPQMSIIPTSDVNLAPVPSHMPVPDPNKVNVAPVSAVRNGQQCKDLNYCKNLVRQHGNQRNNKEQKPGQDGNNHHHRILKRVHEMNAENFRPKIVKQCSYFDTPKGCRNGVNCQFKHDVTFKNQNTKRMKVCGEVTGMT
ncbi:Zinc finger CCCH domain-containing protein 6, partial [Cucurbita argyrosperma subsp. sororia]